MTGTIRLFVVDDHPIVRQGLVAVLEDESDFAVVGAFPSSRSGPRRAHLGRTRRDPLLDLELSGMDGVAAITPILAARPATRILVFTAYDTSERALRSRPGRRVRRRGAPGRVLPRLARRHHAAGRGRAPRRGGGRLSERERAVLRLVATGLTSKQIARELAITERTVQFHVTGLLKLGAHSAQAVAIAAERGLL